MTRVEFTPAQALATYDTLDEARRLGPGDLSDACAEAGATMLGPVEFVWRADHAVAAVPVRLPRPLPIDAECPPNRHLGSAVESLWDELGIRHEVEALAAEQIAAYERSPDAVVGTVTVEPHDPDPSASD